MSNVQKIVGCNIRRLRISKGLTISQLAEMISDDEYVFSTFVVGSWQRAQRPITVDGLVRVAKALQYNPQALLGDSDMSQAQLLARQILSMPRRDLDTLYFARTKWDGNPRALGEMIRLYCACDTEAHRALISRHAAQVFSWLMREGMKPQIDVDLAYLKREIAKLR